MQKTCARAVRHWFPILLLFVLVVSIAYSQEKIVPLCDDNYCVFKRADVERLQQFMAEMLAKIEQLEGDNKRLRNISGCS